MLEEKIGKYLNESKIFNKLSPETRRLVNKIDKVIDEAGAGKLFDELIEKIYNDGVNSKK